MPSNFLLRSYSTPFNGSYISKKGDKMKKEEFKKWWKEHKKVIGMVTVLSAIAVGGAVALVLIEKDFWKKGQKIIDGVVSDTKKAKGIIDLPKPDIKGAYIHEFWCENAEPGSGMGVKAIIAVDQKVADVGDVFKKLAKAGNVDTDLNGFWATVEWDCND